MERPSCATTGREGDSFIVSISWWILLKYLTSSTYVPTISVSIINKQENTRKSNICYQASYKYSHEWHPVQERPSIKMLKGDCCSESKYQYSLVCFALFCLVKRIIEYFAKEWSEQKVSITDVVGLYSTYQKYIMIGAPNSYQFREKWTWVFYQKNLQNSKHFFYEK